MDAKTFEATSENFAAEVLGAEQPVLVDFWAEWCGPCKMVAPVVEELASEYDGRMKVGKLDADANPEVIMQYGVMGIPTLMLFVDGQAVERVTGFRPRESLVAELNLASHLN